MVFRCLATGVTCGFLPFALYSRILKWDFTLVEETHCEDVINMRQDCASRRAAAIQTKHNGQTYSAYEKDSLAYRGIVRNHFGRFCAEHAHSFSISHRDSRVRQSLRGRARTGG